MRRYGCIIRHFCFSLTSMETIVAAANPRKSAKSLIPSAYVRSILAAYAKYGVDPGPALKRAHIPPDIANAASGRISAAQFEALSWLAMRELDDEALGWFSRRLPWGAYGMLCRASLTSPNLGVALRRWTRHHTILTDEVAYELNVEGGVAHLAVKERVELGEAREFCLVTLLRYTLGFACWAIDEKIQLIQAEFPFAEPAHSALYPTIFAKNTKFLAPCARISFDAAYLDKELRRDEAALNKMLRRALPLTVLPYRRDELLAGRVKQALLKPNVALPGAEDVAEALNVSTRTLHRQLQKEGVTLRELKQAARLERARKILARSPHPVKRIAFELGFHNEKSFSRAFRTWTGESPSSFRERMRARPL